MKPAGSNFPTDFESLADVVDCRSPALVACRTVWVASSRLPKKLDTIPEFFDALLKLASQLDPTKDSLITARGTTCHDFVCRIGQLFQIPVVTLHVENDSAKWERLKDTLSGNSSDIAVLDSEKVGVDFLLGMLACEVFVLSIRPNGNLHRAVSSRLEHGKKTRVVIGNPLVKKSLVDQLLDHGATGWYLMKGLESESPTDPQPCSVIAADDFDSSSYLLHWTRRRTGPWPDESDSKFLDDLIFGCSGKDHAVLSVLKRILAMERIVAGSKLTRSPRPVVCFSDLTFQQLQKRRVFRAHLSRWDFEPFGFGIAKSSIFSIEARTSQRRLVDRKGMADHWRRRFEACPSRLWSRVCPDDPRRCRDRIAFALAGGRAFRSSSLTQAQTFTGGCK